MRYANSPLAAMTLAILGFAFTSFAPAAVKVEFTQEGGSYPFFGHGVTVLPNGNIVVVATQYTDPGGPSGVGAVYLFSPGGRMISKLKGTYAFDNIGNGGVKVLANGNYVIVSPFWNANGETMGAVTWGDQDTGVSGTISASNSLIGARNYSPKEDAWGGDVVALANGNYVVISTGATVGGLERAGAVTWGNGNTGVKGTISAANSLVGSTVGEAVGSGGVFPLTNGNYVVATRNSFNATGQRTGAVTWGNGATGTAGAVSATNSLVGTKEGEFVGYYTQWTPGVVALSNGNYVVRTPSWGPNNEGAVTWGNGSTGLIGVVSAANSFVGANAEAKVGDIGLTALTNGNYVITSSKVDHGAALSVGAVTWGNGATGSVGVVSSANSLVGSHTSDNVGSKSFEVNLVTALANGHYVVASPSFQATGNGQTGAVTWANGETGLSGEVSATNSLFGKPGDLIGLGGITALRNGNYVVCSPYWYNGDNFGSGAATWCDGSGPVSGGVTAANSLVGNGVNQSVGSKGAVALANGNYVVCSPEWESGYPENLGAATWGNGSTGTVGVVGSENSLIGSAASDQVGQAVVPLSNGNYVVVSSFWDRGAILNAGAVTWGNGWAGISGSISPENSLVGSTAGECVGSSHTSFGEYFPRVLPTADGNYMLGTQDFRIGGVINGAVTLGDGFAGTKGEITPDNSVVGGISAFSYGQPMSYDPDRKQLVVGQRDLKKVALFSYGVPDASQVIFEGLGTASVRFKGTPQQTHVVQRSTNLIDWDHQWEIDASGAGAVFFTDTDAPAGTAYYRLVSP